jgi:hypothetical protein
VSPFCFRCETRLYNARLSFFSDMRRASIACVSLLLLPDVEHKPDSTVSIKNKTQRWLIPGNGGGGGFTARFQRGSLSSGVPPAPCSDTRKKRGFRRHTMSSAGRNEGGKKGARGQLAGRRGGSGVSECRARGDGARQLQTTKGDPRHGAERWL